MNTKQRDIYIISAIQDCWKHLGRSDIDLNTLQSIDIIELEEDEEPIPSQVHERVDNSTVYLDDIDSNRITNKDIVAVAFSHLHKQPRKDNYCVRIYVKAEVKTKHLFD
jgi:hypothetical protein